MKWLWILWGILSVITFFVTFFLSAIDVIEDEDAFVLTVCIVVFPLGIFVLTCAFFMKLHIFLYKHKNKIRKFLKIKD